MLTSTMSRLFYARILIEMDLMDDISHSIIIIFPSRKTLVQRVIYETLSKFYKHCKALGHTTTFYSKTSINVGRRSLHFPVIVSVGLE
ncbi:arginine-glutamic acid dipeptide repeat protein [Salix suchowensis]|nr:arginine-glutamic acid dipeptide repeat protein [Salix suchowensis]